MGFIFQPLSQGEFEKTTIGSIGLFVVQLTFIYLNLRLIYTVPNLVVEELPFGRALKKSWTMTKRGGFRLLWRILSFEFLLTFLGILLILGLVFTLTVIDKRRPVFLGGDHLFGLDSDLPVYFYSLDKGGIARHYLGFCMGSTEPIGHALQRQSKDEGALCPDSGLSNGPIGNLSL